MSASTVSPSVTYALAASISAGADRMTAAGRCGVPQIVAPGCYDLVDFVGWQAPPARLSGREVHAHNRLLSSALLNADERREVARALCERLAEAKGPSVFLLPLRGCNEWDRPGAPLQDAAGLAAFIDEMRKGCPENTELREIDAHINDSGFADAALHVVDGWLVDGTLSMLSKQ